MHDDSSLRLRDGRLLGWHEYGTPNGRPLYVFHGFPGSRLQAGLIHQQASAAGVHLIAPERPGFGLSDPQPTRRMLDWPDDVAQLADHLGHRRFGVLGVSCGGPYALACAFRLASRLDYVGTMAGVGAMDVPAIRREQMLPLRMLFGLARAHPRLTAPLLAFDAKGLRHDPVTAVRKLAHLLTEPDRRVLQSAGVASTFAHSMAEAYARGTAGAMREVQLIAAPREFDAHDIRIPVHLYQGSQDRHVPLAMSRHLAERILNAKLRIYPDEGHLSVFINRIDDCLEDFLAASSGMSIADSSRTEVCYGN